MPTYKLFHFANPQTSPEIFESAPFALASDTLAFPSVYYNTLAGDVDEAILYGLYRCVATLVADNLEDLFRKTNSISSHWALNAGIETYFDRLRSTSIGDVALQDDGTLYACKCVGWEVVDAQLASLFIDHTKARPEPPAPRGPQGVTL